MHIGQERVCVTGASGFVGSHAVRELLERGHRVVGTVRDPGNEAKTGHLRALPGAAERLELAAADLLEPGSFDEAMAGCVAVVHTAAAVRLSAPNPEEDIVRPSVEGTENVLNAVARAGTVRDFVHTSSVAAVNSKSDPNRTYSEDDWAGATLEEDPYGLAKEKAERKVQAHAVEHGYRFVAINPSLVLGPVYTKAHAKGSPGVVRDHLQATYPACPPLYFGVVDVREVVDAMANALERSEVAGRYIVSAGGLSMQQMAKELARFYPDRKIKTARLPKFVFYLAALFDKRLSLSTARRLAGRTITYDTTKSETQLGLRYRPMQDSLRDTAESMIAGGFVS